MLPTRKSGYFFALKKIAIIQADSPKGIKKRDLIHSTQRIESEKNNGKKS